MVIDFLKDAVGEYLNDSRTTPLSDGQKGLIAALRISLTRAALFRCSNHKKDNLQSGFRHKNHDVRETLKLYHAALDANTRAELLTILERLPKAAMEIFAFHDLSEFFPAVHPNCLEGRTTSNTAESLNDFLKVARSLPIGPALHEVVLLCGQWLDARRADLRKHIHKTLGLQRGQVPQNKIMLPPRVAKKVDASASLARAMRQQNVTARADETTGVVHIGGHGSSHRSVVNVYQYECCAAMKLRQWPCAAFMLATMTLDVRVHDVMPRRFLLETWASQLGMTVAWSPCKRYLDVKGESEYEVPHQGELKWEEPKGRHLMSMPLRPSVQGRPPKDGRYANYMERKTQGGRKQGGTYKPMKNPGARTFGHDRRIEEALRGMRGHMYEGLPRRINEIGKAVAVVDVAYIRSRTGSIFFNGGDQRVNKETCNLKPSQNLACCACKGTEGVIWAQWCAGCMCFIHAPDQCNKVVCVGDPGSNRLMCPFCFYGFR